MVLVYFCDVFYKDKPIKNKAMTISALQSERAKYQPKLPNSLKSSVKLVEGEKTQSIADQK